MTNKTKPQLVAENLALRARLAELEAELATLRSRGRAESEDDLTERQRVEEALQASEIRYRRLFETAKDGILILDAGSGRITDCNPFLEQMLGYSHAELMDKRLWEIGQFRDIAASQTAFQQLQDKEYIRYDNLPLESKGGDRRQVEFVSNLYLVDHTKVIQCNIRDITARKVAETRAQETTEKLSDLVAVLQQRDREMTMLNQMNDLLQTCESREEAYRIIALNAAELFAGQDGCLAVFQPSGQYLEAVARWGSEPLVENVFALDDCWALRRGRPHEVMNPQNSLLCSHFIRPPETGYLCLPLTVQGETLGVLYLSSPSPAAGKLHDGQRQLVVSVGEAIKLSLANLRLRKKLHEQATRDPLTGLFNRRYLEDTFPRELHRSLRNRAPLSVAMVDLDSFKAFNDTFGHEAGDLVLRECGRLLYSKLRRSDIACRYGGEEFVIVLPDSSLADAQQRLDQIRVLLEVLELRREGLLLGTITLSAGVAAAPEHGSDTEDLLRAADAALYAAKRYGRNCVVAYQAPQSDH